MVIQLVACSRPGDVAYFRDAAGKMWLAKRGLQRPASEAEVGQAISEGFLQLSEEFDSFSGLEARIEEIAESWLKDRPSVDYSSVLDDPETVLMLLDHSLVAVREGRESPALVVRFVGRMLLESKAASLNADVRKRLGEALQEVSRGKRSAPSGHEQSDAERRVRMSVAA